MTATYDVLIPPFNFRVQTDIALVEQNLHTLYGQQVLPEGSLPFIDYHIAVRHSTGLRRWFRPQASFFCDQLNRLSFASEPSVCHAGMGDELDHCCT